MDMFSDDISTDSLDLAVQLLRESRTAFLQLFHSSPVCMSMTTTDPGKRVYVRVNRAFLEKFGFTEAEIIGRTSAEIGILDTDESLKVGAMLREKGRLQNDYVKCLTSTGQVVHTMSSIEMMEINNETCLVSFFVDVTRIMEQQAIIERHALQLEALNKELEAFSYSVSHDLRAPLRAIDGYTRMLEEDYGQQFDAEGKRLLSTVQRNVARMGNLIDDLLAFARLGKKAVQKSALDMSALVREVVDELTRTTGCKAEVIVATLHPARGDYALIKQVVINLVSNALKYSARKSSPVVEVTSMVQNGMTTYVVKDNGEGFDMAHAGKLFGVFQRLHSAAEFEGTGVGLAIVQRIVSRHGGAVQAEAEVGKGAVFSFSLPME